MPPKMLLQAYCNAYSACGTTLQYSFEEADMESPDEGTARVVVRSFSGHEVHASGGKRHKSPGCAQSDVNFFLHVGLIQ